MLYNRGVWRTANVNKWVKKVTVGKKTESGLPVTIEYLLKDIDVPYTVEYLVRNDGSVQVTASIDLSGTNLPEIPRFGMRMDLEQKFDSLSYYGRGPLENYIDRHNSSFIGKYESNVTRQYFPYSRPQETGNNTDIRWLKLTSKDGVGLEVIGMQPIAFSALHFTPEDLDPVLTRKLQHEIDVFPHKDVTLHVDLKQRGLGGDDSWGAYPYSQYRLLDKKYLYSIILKLFTK